ncbi:hypothetical protein N8Z07_01080, partial [Pelagibacteraceae bacterium]|nr:hypothetical protein [Pelagibacteraceae bacterium]
SKIDYLKIIIFLSFCISLIVSKYYLNNYDSYFIDKNGKEISHKMIKSDTYRYLAHGAQISEDLKNGKNFFLTGREHFTKYLPPRIAAAYYYFFDKDLFNNFEEKRINTGVHFPYLVLQCLTYYLSLLFLYIVISKKIKRNICLPIVIFLALEPTIFQYHGTFWSESIFFSLQIILFALILRNKFTFYDFFMIGIALSLLSLQRQTAYFFIIPLTFYFLINLKKNEYHKLLFMLFGFMLVQSFVGYNNLVREGKFYILTGDSKSAVYYNIAEPIIKKSKNLTTKEFRIKEVQIATNWLQKNSIAFDEKKLDDILNKNSPFSIVKKSIINPSDKVLYDNFYAKRTVDILLDNFWISFKLIFKNSLHSILLNPFHIYSDHNFKSAEYYYFTTTHDKLVPPRIIYSILLYFICLVGFFTLIKEKKYQLLSIIMLSILYNLGMVSWHGNTRYVVPILIYMSFLFGYGCNNLLSIKKKINK